MKLSLNEQKLLAALRFNARASAAQIAKLSHLPQHSVYRYQRQLEEKGILTPYVVVNLAALGLCDFGIFVSAERSSASLRQRLLSFLVRSPSVPWVVEYSAGEFQYAFSVVAKHISEVDNFLMNLSENTGQACLRQSVLNRVSWEVYGERYLPGAASSMRGYRIAGTCEKVASLDELDWALLRLLSAPRLATLKELARGLGEPLTTVEYRLKVLEKTGVIIGYCNLLDLSKVGVQYYHALLSERKRSRRFRQKLLAYFQRNPRVVATTLSVGEWNYEFELNVSEPDEVQSLEADLCEEFPEDTFTLKLLHVNKVHKMQPLPSVVTKI